MHPAKREVRFRRPSEVTLAVMDAVAATLAAHARGDEAAPEPAPRPAMSPVTAHEPVAPAIHPPRPVHITPDRNI